MEKSIEGINNLNVSNRKCNFEMTVAILQKNLKQWHHIEINKYTQKNISDSIKERYD